jgi:hypothetical protein
MILSKKGQEFEPCPEFIGKAVCVDVTPLKKQTSEFGEREIFRVVFEVDVPREDGSRFCVWSKGFTASLHEKANFRKFLKMWFGRDLTEEELASFDTESLIGRGAQVNVIHEEHEGKTYANIVACTPDKSGAPLLATGKFIRAKDREDHSGHGRAESGSGSGGGRDYRRAEQGPARAAGPVDHALVKIHVGSCAGHELRDLSEEQVKKLVANWLPIGRANAKPTADDRRLMGALDWWVAMQAKATADAAADEVPY